MEIVVNGLFNLNEDKNFVLLTEQRNEAGTLEVLDGEISARVGNDVIKFYGEDDAEAWITEHKYMITEETNRWHKYNPNPITDKANDCSFRAYCAAEGMAWEEAYRMAVEMGISIGYMPNDNSTCTAVMDSMGYEYVKITREQKEKGYNVKEFARDHSVGTYIVSVRGHLVTVIDGQYWDSWDSGKKKLKGYWVKKDK